MKGAYAEKMGPDAAAFGPLAIFDCGHTFPTGDVSNDGRLDNIECPICSRADDHKSKFVSSITCLFFPLINPSLKILLEFQARSYHRRSEKLKVHSDGIDLAFVMY